MNTPKRIRFTDSVATRSEWYDQSKIYELDAAFADEMVSYGFAIELPEQPVEHQPEVVKTKRTKTK